MRTLMAVILLSLAVVFGCNDADGETPSDSLPSVETPTTSAASETVEPTLVPTVTQQPIESSEPAATSVPTEAPVPSCPNNLGEGAKVLEENEAFCFVSFNTGDLLVFTALTDISRFRDEKIFFSNTVRGILEGSTSGPCDVIWTTANFELSELVRSDLFTDGC